MDRILKKKPNKTDLYEFFINIQIYMNFGSQQEFELGRPNKALCRTWDGVAQGALWPPRAHDMAAAHRGSDRDAVFTASIKTTWHTCQTSTGNGGALE
jgi:hypothetical protein